MTKIINISETLTIQTIRMAISMFFISIIITLWGML